VLTRRRFRSLADWLAFCCEPDADTDAVQQVGRRLEQVLSSHEDSAELINLWLARGGSTYRLFPVVGKRTRAHR
jgi:hypothetical protein